MVTGKMRLRAIQFRVQRRSMDLVEAHLCVPREWSDNRSVFTNAIFSIGRGLCVSEKEHGHSILRSLTISENPIYGD
jgi:hypothetical protein